MEMYAADRFLYQTAEDKNQGATEFFTLHPWHT